MRRAAAKVALFISVPLWLLDLGSLPPLGEGAGSRLVGISIGWVALYGVVFLAVFGVLTFLVWIAKEGK